jgi:hypothetical protein
LQALGLEELIWQFYDSQVRLGILDEGLAAAKEEESRVATDFEKIAGEL